MALRKLMIMGFTYEYTYQYRDYVIR